MVSSIPLSSWLADSASEELILAFNSAKVLSFTLLIFALELLSPLSLQSGFPVGYGQPESVLIGLELPQTPLGHVHMIYFD